MEMLKTIIGIIVGIGFVLIIGFVIMGLIKTSFSSQKLDGSTLSSFEDITRIIQSLGLNEERKVTLDIRNPFSIVGINTDNDAIHGIELSHRYYVAKFNAFRNPCNKACLCICEYDKTKQTLDGSACLKDKCIEFDNVNGFSGWGTEGGDGNYLFLEGRGNLELDKPYTLTIKNNENILSFEREGLE